MARQSAVSVSIPASTANLGPGFDTVGMAFSLYSSVEMSVAEKTVIELVGPELQGLPQNKSNLLYEVAADLFREAGQAVPELHIRASSDAPLTRGLGSSAAAIVGALVAANQLAGQPFSREDLFRMASWREGHPDNVGASLFGGVVVASMPENEDEPIPFVRFAPPEALHILAIIPNAPLSTEKARNVLPTLYSKQDVIYNVGHSSLLVAALAHGRLDLLSQAMKDRMHQPYRAKLVPGLSEILAGANEHGALGATLSGAGPTILCFYQTEADLGRLSPFVEQVMSEQGVAYRAMQLKPDHHGAQVVFEER